MDNIEKVAYIDDFLTQEEMDSVVSSFANGYSVDSDIVDKMDISQIELALMEAGFTGAISDDISNGTAYYATSKNNMVSLFQDDLVNEMQGYGMDDNVQYDVLYKDGTRKYLSHDMENDFDSTHITRNMGKQAYTNAKNALKISKVAAIIRSDGYEQPKYYISKGGEQAMRDYGFEFWENGRGEKQRDYIQYDWL